MSKAKGVSVWLAVATLLGILGLVLYIWKGRTSFDPNYSVYVFIGMGAGIACGVAGWFLRIRALAFMAYLGFLYGFIHYIVSQINLIANIIYGVDGSTFPPVFFVTVVSAFASFVLSLIAGIAMKKQQPAAKA